MKKKLVVTKIGYSQFLDNRFPVRENERKKIEFIPLLNYIYC